MKQNPGSPIPLKITTRPFSSSSRWSSPALRLHPQRKRLARHQTEAIRTGTRLRDRTRFSASQPASSTTPSVVKRSLVTPPAAKIRPMVFKHCLARGSSRAHTGNLKPQRTFVMKKNRPQLAVVLTLAIGIATAQAGTIFYQAIPATQSDVGSGIGTDNQYTSAVDGGNARGTDRVINGITLYSLAANGQTATADNCTLNALAGNLSNAAAESTTTQADGVFKAALSDMTFNNGATDNSQQEIVLNPESLEVGATYDLRIYICGSSGQNRQVNLFFVGDGQPPVETGFFNEDDAQTSAGGFKDANQAYYINYRFTWDGDSTPGETITQRSGSAPFVLDAWTNQVVSDGVVATEGEGQQALAVDQGEQ